MGTAHNLTFDKPLGLRMAFPLQKINMMLFFCIFATVSAFILQFYIETSFTFLRIWVIPLREMLNYEQRHFTCTKLQ